MWIRTLWIALLVSLGGCVTAGTHAPYPNVYVMRHLHTPAGATNPDLTEVGLRHAGLLDQWFRRDPPDVIYVSSTKRAQQTAALLASRLGLTPKIYDPADTPALIAAVAQEKGTVLVVGHSNTVPQIVADLGGMRPSPLVHEDFADIWRVAGPTRVTSRFKLGE